MNATEERVADATAPATRVADLAREEAGERVDLPITGMTCAACARRIERRLSKVAGVRRAGVNFATARATVEYEPGATGVGEFVRTIEETGYGVLPVGGGGAGDAEDLEAKAREEEYREARRKFVVAALLSLPVLVVAMSHGRLPLLDFPGVNWLQLALTTPVVFYCGAQFYRGAWAAFRHRAADMNTLVAVGTGAAYLYSTAATVAPGFFAGATADSAMPGMGTAAGGGMSPPVYFEAASVIIALLLLGRLLESRATLRTGDAVRRLLSLQAKTARVVREGRERDLPVEEVLPGDLVVVRPGERIPFDGRVADGARSVDESMLTG